MKKLIPLPLLIILFASVGGTPQQSAISSGKSEYQALLDESLSLGKSMGEVDKMWYLGDLLNVSVSLQPEHVRDLANDLFDLSRRSQVFHNNVRARMANEKVAAVALSRVDAQMGMELFAKIEEPELNSAASEDVRAHAARTVFVNFVRMKGPGALPLIEGEAKHIGKTGAYPHHAMGLVISELVELRTERLGETTDAVLTDALTYYNRGSSILNEDSEFLALLENAKGSASGNLFRQAAEAFVSHVKQKIKLQASGDQRELFKAVVRTEKGSIDLNNQNELLLFRAFPVISDALGTSEKAQLLRDFPVLQRAGDKIETVATTSVPAGLPAEKIRELQNKGIEESLLVKIESLKKTNPRGALDLANTLGYPARITGMSAALSDSVVTDTQELNRVYAKELTNLSTLRDSPDKVRARALAATAKVAYYAGDFDNFNYLSSQAIDLALKSFDDSVRTAPKLPADSRPGYEELTSLTEFGMAHDCRWLFYNSSQTENSALKAHLLMFAAKGLSERTSNQADVAFQRQSLK